MEYTEAVKEARTLVKRSEADQWRLAELTWEQLQTGITQRQWAQDIGKAQSWVSTVSRMWERYGDLVEDRPAFAPTYTSIIAPGFHQESQDHGSQYTANARVAVRNMDPEQKAEVVREALADDEVRAAVVDLFPTADPDRELEAAQVKEAMRDPEMAAEIIADPDAGRALNQAYGRQSAEQTDQAERRYKRDHGDSAADRAWLELIGAWTRSVILRREAFENVLDEASMTSGRWDTLVDMAEAGQRIDDALRAYRAGDKGQLDAELAALLEGA